MLAYKNKLFQHIPKCGGTTVETFFKEKHREDIEYHIHQKSLHTIPDQYKSYEKVIIIRNPLTWYISYYHYMAKQQNTNFSGSPFNRNIVPVLMLRKDPYDTSSGVVSLEVFMDRALNINKFFNEPQINNFIRESLLINKHDNINKNIFTNFKTLMYKDRLEFEPTLYQFLLTRYGILDKFDESKIFKLEDGLDEFFKYMGVTDYESTYKKNEGEYNKNKDRSSIEFDIKSKDTLLFKIPTQRSGILLSSDLLYSDPDTIVSFSIFTAGE